MCMETGRTVILLNMENLYESLYDALNQVTSLNVNCIMTGADTRRVESENKKMKIK